MQRELPCSSVAIDLPGRAGIERPPGLSLQGCADHVMRELEGFEPRRLVLVAHSVSGGLAMEVASRLGTRLAGLVLVGAVVARSGQAYVHALPWRSRWLLRALFWVAPEGLAPPPKVLSSALCNGLSESDTARVVERAVAPLPRLFLDRVRWSLPQEVPRVYVMLTDDRSDVTVALQEQVAVRMGAEVVSCDSGHLPMMSRPHELAGILAGLVPEEGCHD